MGNARVLSVGFLTVEDGGREKWMLNECMLKQKSLDVLGQAEMFLQLQGDVDIPSFDWYGHNWVRKKHISGGVELLVKVSIQSKLLLRIKGTVWVELLRIVV